jgi:hypothetical protein
VLTGKANESFREVIAIVDFVAIFLPSSYLGSKRLANQSMFEV